MSSASLHRFLRARSARQVAARLGRRVAACCRAVTFWLAIVLPFALVIAVLGGTVSDRPGVVGLLLLASIVCTWLGHSYAPDTS